MYCTRVWQCLWLNFTSKYYFWSNFSVLQNICWNYKLIWLKNYFKKKLCKYIILFLLFIGCKFYINLFFCNYRQISEKWIICRKYRKNSVKVLWNDASNKIVISQRFFCKLTEKKFYWIKARLSTFTTFCHTTC